MELPLAVERHNLLKPIRTSHPYGHETKHSKYKQRLENRHMVGYHESAVRELWDDHRFHSDLRLNLKAKRIMDFVNRKN